MPVTLTIRAVPDGVAEALRVRAARNHRSVHDELLHILESAVAQRPFRADSLWAELQGLGLTTSDDAVAIVREARDSR